MRTFALVMICAAVVVPAAASSLAPIINNPGFEEVASGNDAPGWGWYTRARAGFHSETANPHSGRRCLVFTNASELAPEVYGRLSQDVAVLPDTEYELTAWVRGEDVASGIHFTDWDSYMMNLPVGTFGWKKVSLTFRTKPSQVGLNLGINIVNRCKELAIDDISLHPIGLPIRGKGVLGSVLVPGQVQGDNKKAFLNINLETFNPGTIQALIKAGDKTIFNKQAPIGKGTNGFEWEWNTGTVTVRDLYLTIAVRNLENKLIATSGRAIEKLSPSVLFADLDKVEMRLKAFDALYAKCKARKIPLDYPTVTRMMLTQFIPLERMDIRRGEERRAGFAIKDFNRSLDVAMAEMTAYLKKADTVPKAVRYKTSKLKIDGLSFIGDRRDTKGKTSRGPLFFCGMGHFDQVRRDMFRWPDYGVNIIQVEIGPGVTFPKEDKIDLSAARAIVRVLNDAAKRNVKVNILLSPHYFPEWALKKWPKLAKGGGGFLGFCVDEPEAKQVIEKFLRTVVPLFKDHPALHSFCLSNEPMFDRSQGTDNAKEMWTTFLRKTHESVALMNQRYGTNYVSFTDVPMPGNDAYDTPQYYDYCIFNQERFAGWHQWMADVVHEMAPDVPVHAKVMGWTFFMRNTLAWGTSPEMFGRFGQINGNDCSMWPGGGPDWAIQWGTQNMTYDLQRSLNRKPIFNSENHLTPDGSSYYVPPEHFRTALWQGAVHGQGATTIWVWERMADPSASWYASTTCFYGNVMDRPGCAEAVGRTCLDLNRFAQQVTALEIAKAPVAILYSTASMARNPKHSDIMGRVYSALNFLGVKVDFISERQVAEGKGAQYKLIVLPEATHLPNEAFHAIATLSSSTRIAVVGEGPQKDPYGNSLMADLIAKKTVIFEAEDGKKMWPRFRTLLQQLGALPEVMVVDAGTGKPAWGIEWLPAQVNGCTVVNLVNLTAKPVEIKIIRSGKIVEARDLLSLGGGAKVKLLQPITPVLAEITRRPL